MKRNIKIIIFMLICIFCILIGCSKKEKNKLSGNEIIKKEKYIINEKNVAQMNNYAYELEQNNKLLESKELLEKILEKYPKRTVAYLNYADVLWKLDYKEEAKKYYDSYIQLLIKENKLEKNLLNEKNIKFANGITLNEVITGDINGDKIKDYVIEYSNMDTEELNNMMGTIEQMKEMKRQYNNEKNYSCFKFLISEKEDYKIFNSCKLVVPLILKGTGGKGGSELIYEIKNNKIIISDRNIDEINSFHDYYIELIYKNKEIVIDKGYYIKYEKIENNKGEIDFVEKKYPNKKINKKLEDFDIERDYSILFD